MDDEISPFLTQLLLDLKNVLWALEARNRILDRDMHGWSNPNIDHIQATASTWVPREEVLEDEESKDEGMHLSIARMERQHRVLLFALVSCLVIGASVFTKLGN